MTSKTPTWDASLHPREHESGRFGFKPQTAPDIELTHEWDMSEFMREPSGGPAEWEQALSPVVVTHEDGTTEEATYLRTRDDGLVVVAPRSYKPLALGRINGESLVVAREQLAPDTSVHPVDVHAERAALKSAQEAVRLANDLSDDDVEAFNKLEESLPDVRREDFSNALTGVWQAFTRLSEEKLNPAFVDALEDIGDDGAEWGLEMRVYSELLMSIRAATVVRTYMEAGILSDADEDAVSLVLSAREDAQALAKQIADTGKVAREHKRLMAALTREQIIAADDVLEELSAADQEKLDELTAKVNHQADEVGTLIHEDAYNLVDDGYSTWSQARKLQYTAGALKVLQSCGRLGDLTPSDVASVRSFVERAYGTAAGL